MDAKELVESLKAIRIEKGLTQADVGRLADASDTWCAALETHTPSNPGILTLQRYADAIGVRLRIDIETEAMARTMHAAGQGVGQPKGVNELIQEQIDRATSMSPERVDAEYAARRAAYDEKHQA